MKRTLGKWLCLVACASCALELPLPAAPGGTPPQPSTATPDALFAGERLVIAGTNLGTFATARVLIGGVPAELAAESTSKALVALLPEDLPAGLLDVTVATAEGEATVRGVVRSLGLGHPRSLALAREAPVGPRFTFAWTGDVRAYQLDRRHDTILEVDQLTGVVVGPSVAVPVNPVASFGSDDDQWVWSQGRLGSGVPRLVRIDFTSEVPRRTCDTGDLAELGDGSQPEETLRVSASADGTLFAAPLGGHRVAIFRTDTCPPVQRIVEFSKGVEGVVVSGEDVVAALFDRFARVLPDGTIVEGPVPADSGAWPGSRGIVAPDPAGGRLAYVRFDGDLGFVEWQAAGAPTLAPQTIFAYEATTALAWGAPLADDGHADRLYAANVERLSVFDLDDTDRDVLATLLIPHAEHLAPVSTGEVFVTTLSGSALVARDGVLLRTWEPGTWDTSRQAYALATGPDGRVLTPTLYGVQSLSPELVSPIVTDDAAGLGLVLTGLTGTPGSPIAWDGSRFHRYDRTTSKVVAGEEVPEGRTIVRAVTDGTTIAGITKGASSLWLDVVGGGAVRSRELTGAERAYVAYGAGRLFVVTQQARVITVTRFEPGTLAMQGSPSIIEPEASFAQPLVRTPFWSRALGALVVSLSNLRSIDDGVADWDAAVLRAVEPDGTVLSSRTVLPPALASPLCLSPDGRLLVLSRRGSGGVDSLWLARDADTLVVRYGQHQDLPASVGDATFSEDGSRLFVTFPTRNALGLLQ